MQPENRSQTYDALFVHIDEGKIKIPKFQREFVWTKEQTAALIDSMIKGFPIGTFLYWETTDELRHVKEIGNHQLKEPPLGHTVSYVLDGQQRITSLYAVRKGSVFRNDGPTEVDYNDIAIDLSLNIDSDEQVVLTSPSDNSISVYRLLNSTIAELVDDHERSQIDKISHYKGRIETYLFSTIVLDGDYSIDSATDIFTRINTTGISLDLFEIMVAKTYSEEREFDLAKKYTELLGNGDDIKGKTLVDAGYETIPPITILRCVAMCLTGEVRRRDILKLDKIEFAEIWEDVSVGLFHAVDFLRDKVGVPVSRLLPYNDILVSFTYFFVKSTRKRPSRKQSDRLCGYFWWCALSGRFSSASETKLAADRRRMDAILADKRPTYRGVDRLPELDENSLIECYFTTGDSFNKAIICLYASQEPKAFDDHGRSVRIDNTWLSQINSRNYHHFFPRAYLRKKKYEEWIMNSVLNITIVDDWLNKREIRAKPPSVYMKKFKKENKQIASTMKTHLIGRLEGAGVWNDDYDAFLSHRAKIVLTKLTEKLALCRK